MFALTFTLSLFLHAAESGNPRLLSVHRALTDHNNLISADSGSVSVTHTRTRHTHTRNGHHYIHGGTRTHNTFAHLQFHALMNIYEETHNLKRLWILPRHTFGPRTHPAGKRTIPTAKNILYSLYLLYSQCLLHSWCLLIAVSVASLASCICCICCSSRIWI